MADLLVAVVLAGVALLAHSESLATLARIALLAFAALLGLDAAVTAYHKSRVRPLAPQPEHYALITGGSSGIGREMAFQLADKGFSLLLVARTQSALAKTQREILALHAKTGVDVLVLSADLSRIEGIQSVLAFATDRSLVIDILVNNAGASWTSDFVDLSVEQVDELLTLNVLATAKLSRALVPQMVARGVGRVLNVASMSAAISIPTAALYGSSKAFVLNASQAMDYELRGSGVSLTSACPGPVHTNFGSAARCDSAIYMNTPGLALDVKECARRLLAAMFRADTVYYDTLVARCGAALFRTLLPTRLGLLVAAVSMNEPQKALAMLRRR
ncbi:hypothetical protein PybrP1_003911 [[Pythium] brassicae (nom. inval.)]|nr:hypothetical protein PybrP1_003911 [[Pythium] brassicae (nom. inval.)]